MEFRYHAIGYPEPASFTLSSILIRDRAFGIFTLHFLSADDSDAHLLLLILLSRYFTPTKSQLMSELRTSILLVYFNYHRYTYHISFNVNLSAQNNDDFTFSFNKMPGL